MFNLSIYSREYMFIIYIYSREYMFNISIYSREYMFNISIYSSEYMFNISIYSRECTMSSNLHVVTLYSLYLSQFWGFFQKPFPVTTHLFRFNIKQLENTGNVSNLQFNNIRKILSKLGFEDIPISLVWGSALLRDKIANCKLFPVHSLIPLSFLYFPVKIMKIINVQATFLQLLRCLTSLFWGRFLKDNQRPNLKNLSCGLNLRRDSNMVGST